MAKKEPLIRNALSEEEMLKRRPSLIGHVLFPDEESIIIPIMTETGAVRKYKVRRERAEKYAKVRGEPAFRKRIEVYNQASGTRRKVAVKRKKDYIYDERYKAYVRYNPRDITEIRVGEETRTVTYEQKRYLYKRSKRGAYVKTRSGERIAVRRRDVISKGRVSNKVQVIIRARVRYKGRIVTKEGFSDNSTGADDVDSLKYQAEARLIMKIAHEYGISSDSVKSDVTFLDTDVRYVGYVGDRR